MRIFNSTFVFALLSLTFINLAQAENVPPSCPEPRAIQELKWLGEVNCTGNTCLYNMGGSEDSPFTFRTAYYWHFSISYKINSPEEIDFASSHVLEIIDNLVYQSGPIESGSPPSSDRYNTGYYTYTCQYSNKWGADVKAVVTNVNYKP